MLGKLFFHLEKNLLQLRIIKFKYIFLNYATVKVAFIYYYYKIGLPRLILLYTLS